VAASKTGLTTNYAQPTKLVIGLASADGGFCAQRSSAGNPVFFVLLLNVVITPRTWRRLSGTHLSFNTAVTA
jgi:hypothetical protein